MDRRQRKEMRVIAPPFDEKIRLCHCGLPFSSYVAEMTPQTISLSTADSRGVIIEEPAILIRRSSRRYTCRNGHQRTITISFVPRCPGMLTGEEECPLCGLNHRD